ncbi:MAG: FAD-binding protein [Clostridia bacterium]|nr:FAD-binding protein [Clostridia bacterium]
MKNRYDVIIIGSGAAGFAAADRLFEYGVRDICIVTENVLYGTSRNAGSDKQTYYKLDLCSDGGDSALKMARDLFSGGSMNGTDALALSSDSIRCFMHLVELGVPFPKDAYGRYAGYKTDHDNTMRATSAGPLTSKYMTERLQRKVISDGTEILDGYTAVKLLVENNICGGVICLHGGKQIILKAGAVILCTGAPAAVYSRSVYPENQCGATGLAIEAGAQLSNFQEWQYGIASVKFRWNLSGSYQQVIPRYFSVGTDGKETEFLTEYGSADEMYSLVFLKGYQWPFDSQKTEGSSLIDILVFRELEKGRRVFIDYRKNPCDYCFEKLSDEAKEYLINAGGTGETPIERLYELNPKAIELYRSHSIDLYNEPLEIGVCAQHNNGGIRTDINSETAVKNLFACGEAAGKFGVYRPGGCALNDTQSGALRAAEYISKGIKSADIEGEVLPLPLFGSENNACEMLKKYSSLMSDCAGIYRDTEKIQALLQVLTELDENYFNTVTVKNENEYGDFYSFRLTLKSMEALCRTVLFSASHAGSRGGCICFEGGEKIPENTEYRKYITVTENDRVYFEKVKEIPDEKIAFEKLLKNMREEER